MFTSLFSATPSFGAGMSSILASISSAIAYAVELDDASIVVRQSGGCLVLDGTAPSVEIRDSALEIARSIARCPVHSQISLIC